MWVVFFYKFGRNRRKGLNFIAFLIFRTIDGIAATLRDFVDSAKILYTNENNADL